MRTHSCPASDISVKVFQSGVFCCKSDCPVWVDTWLLHYVMADDILGPAFYPLTLSCPVHPAPPIKTTLQPATAAALTVPTGTTLDSGGDKSPTTNDERYWFSGSLMGSSLASISSDYL